MVLLTIQMSQYYKGTLDIPKYFFLLEDSQRKAARARLPVTDQTLTVLASTALLAANTFPRTTELWEELDPADKTWAAWKTAYLAAHKKRANCLHATGGAEYLGQAHSAATNEKAVLEQLITSNSSLDTSKSALTNQVKTLHDQLAAKSRGGSGKGVSSNQPGGSDLTLQATVDPTDTMLDMSTPATPAPTPRKATSPPPHATTSWVVLLPTRTGCPTGPSEAPGRMHQQNLSLLRPLIY